MSHGNHHESVLQMSLVEIWRSELPKHTAFVSLTFFFFFRTSTFFIPLIMPVLKLFYKCVIGKLLHTHVNLNIQLSIEVFKFLLCPASSYVGLRDPSRAGGKLSRGVLNPLKVHCSKWVANLCSFLHHSLLIGGISLHHTRRTT